MYLFPTFIEVLLQIISNLFAQKAYFAIKYIVTHLLLSNYEKKCLNLFGKISLNALSLQTQK